MSQLFYWIAGLLPIKQSSYKMSVARILNALNKNQFFVVTYFYVVLILFNQSILQSTYYVPEWAQLYTKLEIEPWALNMLGKYLPLSYIPSP